MVDTDLIMGVMVVSGVVIGWSLREIVQICELRRGTLIRLYEPLTREQNAALDKIL